MFGRCKRSRQAELDDYTVEPMEPRVLLSADALGVDAGVLDHDTAGQADWDLKDADDWSRSLASHDIADTAPLTPVGDDTDSRVEIVFLDAGVEDGQQLLADLLSQNGSTITQVHLIDSNSDGVDQIAQVLAGQQGIDAIHIISHGAAGQIQLGSGTLSTDSLDGYAGQLNDWGSTLADSGDILIYGCDLAADTQGRALVNAIGILTGADVAASVDQTGHAAQGGDWDLEYQVGRSRHSPSRWSMCRFGRARWPQRRSTPSQIPGWMSSTRTSTTATKPSFTSMSRAATMAMAACCWRLISLRCRGVPLLPVPRWS